MAELVNGVTTPTQNGTAGVADQAAGSPSSVSAAANAQAGGIAAGNFIEPDIDDELFRYQSDDTPLMSIMLKTKKKKVNSPVVDHYQMDEQRAVLSVKTAVSANTTNTQFTLPLEAEDAQLARPSDTILVKGVNGANGGDLMLFVKDIDSATGNPICQAVNGTKKSGSTLCSVPAISAGTKCVLLSNALYETQKEVDPDLIIPQPTEVYLQKRGMNQIVSDYFDSQKKRIPFTQAVIAEQAILNFKRKGNRTLWAGRKGKGSINVPKLGQQDVYFTEGIRWQFKKELEHTGKWTIEKLIALAKMFYTGEDVPKSALLLAGKNLLEEIQCIDFTGHPEIQMMPFTNETFGWAVTRIHTVFGDIDIKREPTLDTLGWSNSGALIGEDRLVHYAYTTEHEFSDRVEGEEATRKGVIVWDALALKGSCHIWIDGEGAGESAADATPITIWDSTTAPTAANAVNGMVYYFIKDVAGVPASGKTAQSGTMWKAKVADSTLTWTEFTGEIYAG